MGANLLEVNLVQSFGAPKGFSLAPSKTAKKMSTGTPPSKASEYRKYL